MDRGILMEVTCPSGHLKVMVMGLEIPSATGTPKVDSQEVCDQLPRRQDVGRATQLAHKEVANSESLQCFAKDSFRSIDNSASNVS